MSNRLPPAWAKHLRAQSAPTRTAAPKVGVPKAQSPKAGPSRAQADDMLLRQALELQKAERLAEAEELCHRVLARTREHPLALYILGTLGLGFDDELAIRYLERAVVQEPNNPYYRLSLGEAWLKVEEFPPAIEHLRRACELKPDLVEALCSLGLAYTKFDKAEMALPAYRKALEIDAEHPLARIGLARTLIGLGRTDEAASYLKESIARRVAVAEAHHVLASTRKFAAAPPELEAILSELGSPSVPAEERHDLHLAAGKILNDLRNYDDAMDHFLKGKSLKAQQFDFDIEAYRSRVDALIDLFGPKLLAEKQGFGDMSETPVFVLGMPRSGTTLTEQICSSHPDVHGAGELAKLPRMAVANGLKFATGRAFGEPIRSLTLKQSQELARQYLSNLDLYTSVAPRIVDKMPHNFELVGLIAILFPRARIIHCRRDAIDNCVSCFISNLQKAHSYSYDLTKLGLYYREYDRLMRHWQALLPGRIFENRYEEMVADQEGQSRRLIDHLGLPWDEACLRFFEKEGSVRTISHWQVRQPIYTSSVKRWKNYGDKIQPLIDALGDLAQV